MAKRIFPIAAIALVFTLLFVSIVYACSGLDQVRMSFQHSSMDGGTMVERGPCSEHKQDLCKSVRHRMLSIQAPSTQTENSAQVLATPLEPFVEASTTFYVSLASLQLSAAFHPLFKLPLTYSYLVLRI